MTGDNFGKSIAIDGSGNIVVSGLFNGTMDFNPGTGTATLASTGWATFVARYSSAGTYLWAFQIGPYSNANDVAVDANGNVVVVGTFKGTVDFNPGSGTATLSSVNAGGRNNASNTTDLFVAKYSSSGTYLWAFRIGNAYGESAKSVAVDNSGNIYITGELNPGSIDFDPGRGTANLTGGTYVAKYTGAGTYLWAFNPVAGGTPELRIAVDGSGIVVVTGGFTGTVDFNPGSGTANLTGSGTNGNYDIFVASYNSSGGYQWAFTPSVGSVFGVSIDGSGDILMTGTFKGTNDFDPGSGTASLARDATYDNGAFVASYTSSGTYRWAFSIPTAGTTGRGIASNGSGDIYLTGSINILTADFDPSSSTANLTSAGGADIFIAKYTEATQPKRSTGSSMGSGENAIALQVAPNPFTGAFAFHHDGTTVRIEIIDMMGGVVESRDVDGATEIMLGAELPAGAYIVRTTQGESRRQVMVRKVR
jgi:hypothetical protein